MGEGGIGVINSVQIWVAEIGRTGNSDETDQNISECLCECIEDTSESECASAIRESIESLIILHSSTELHFTGEITF